MTCSSTRRICAFRLLAAALLLAGAGAAAQTGPQACGNPFVNHYGPWDFRLTTPQQRAIVEAVHFTRGIETLTRPGNTMMHDMAQDVAYTLGVYPNHPRALLTMVRLSQRWKKDPPPGTKLSVECWFDRAVRFRPDDTVARAFYAQFLHQSNRSSEAAAQLDIAVGFAGDNPLSHNNLGLLYVEIGQLDKALRQAHRAQALGFARPELKLALEKAGKWVEPKAIPTNEAGPASGPSAAP